MHAAGAAARACRSGRFVAPAHAGGAAAESPPPPPSDDELALALDARVESWQAFVRCAQHLAAQCAHAAAAAARARRRRRWWCWWGGFDAAAAAPAVDEALVSALPRLLGEVLAPPSATLVAAARRAAFDRQRDAYAQLVVGQLSRGASAAAEAPPPAEAVEAKRQRARDDLEAAYAAALFARAGPCSAHRKL